MFAVRPRRRAAPHGWDTSKPFRAEDRSLGPGGKEPETIPARNVIDLAISPDRTQVGLIDSEGLHTRGKDGNWRGWDQRTSEPESSLTFSPDGVLIATRGGQHGEIVRVRNTGKEPATFPPLLQPEEVVGLHFTADGRRLLTLDRTGVVRTWELACAAPTSLASVSDKGLVVVSGDSSRFLT